MHRVHQIEREILEKFESGVVFDSTGQDYGLEGEKKLTDFAVKNSIFESLIEQGHINCSKETLYGITPTGVHRLQELQHPVRTWCQRNWFPLVVAVITAVVSIAGIVTDVLTR